MFEHLVGMPIAFFGSEDGYTNYEVRETDAFHVIMYVCGRRVDMTVFFIMQSSTNDQEMVFTNDLGLTVQIKTGTTPQTSSVSVTGTVSHVITDARCLGLTMRL